jgi:hypothetical protein
MWIRIRIRNTGQNPDEVTRIDVRQEGRHGMTSRYEVSNLSRRGLECRHNLFYWSGGQYVGLGTIHISSVMIKKGLGYERGCGFGWIGIYLSCWVRIRMQNTDPDRGVEITL